MVCSIWIFWNFILKSPMNSRWLNPRVSSQLCYLKNEQYLTLIISSSLYKFFFVFLGYHTLVFFLSHRLFISNYFNCPPLCRLNSGAPQGSVLISLLCPIYIHYFDGHSVSQLCILSYLLKNTKKQKFAIMVL